MMTKTKKKQRVHKHSIAAYQKFIASGRRMTTCMDLIKFMLANKPMTVRKISDTMGKGHKSEIQPRVSDLLNDGIFETFGKEFDEISKTDVYLVRIKMNQESFL